MNGYVSSIQSLGAVDGPGVRCVIFMQGCVLRCKCCHNPETWEFGKGEEYTPERLMGKIRRYVSYFGSEGGVTVSGGEPLCQSEFVTELFKICRQEGINTCLDTSGCLMNDSVRELLDVTDIVLLDYKMTNEQDYYSFSGMHQSAAEEFLKELQKRSKRVWLREVIVPSINDNAESVAKLLRKQKEYPCIEKIELLPFHKACVTKYDELGIKFPLKDIPEATKENVSELFARAEKLL